MVSAQHFINEAPGVKVNVMVLPEDLLAEVFFVLSGEM